MKITLNENNLIEKTLIKLQELISNTSFENHVFICGGFVRDKIMGLTPKDIDLCVDIEYGGIAFSEYICRIAKCYKADSNPVIYPKFQTAKFNLRGFADIENVDIECVQTRTEKYNKEQGRKPDVGFGTLLEDSLRRDLTINAMYINLTTLEVVDPCNKGLRDIKNCILRTPTDSTEIFSDDPLRMLRVIRFANKLNWGIEKNTWFGIIKNAYKIIDISQERITDEISKILMCEFPSYGLKQLKNSGLLYYVLPEIRDLVGIEQGEEHFGDVFEHTLSVVDNTNPILTHRFAALFHDVGKYIAKTNIQGNIHFYGHEIYGEKMVNSILKSMKLPNNDIKLISRAVRNHMRFKSSNNNCPSNKAIRKFITSFNDDEIKIILDVMHADNISHSEKYCLPNQVPLIIKKINEIIEKENLNSNTIKLPINGNDIMKEFNLPKGPIIGKLLESIKELYLENPNITKEDCIKYIQKKLTV